MSDFRGEGETTQTGGSSEPTYGGTMVHDINIPEGGSETGSVVNEGPIIDLDKNPIYDEIDPVFQFRDGSLPITPKMTKALLYTLLGYFGIWKGLLKK